MENVFYVYLHRRKTDNKVFYVGKGKGNRATSKHGRSEWWKRTADKHGFEVEIVFDNLSEEESFECEKNTILEFRYFGHPLVNMTDGGEGMSGHKPSKETLAKRSEKLKGQKRTPEQCRRISESITGRKLSPSVIDGMVKRRTGVARSPESVRKTAEANRGKKRTLEQRKRLSEGHSKRVKDASERKEKSKSLKKQTPKEKLAKSSPTSQKRNGSNNPNSDKQLYVFVNINTGQQVCSTRVEFCQKTGISAKSLTRLFGKSPHSKTCFGWKLQKENNATKTEEKTEEH